MTKTTTLIASCCLALLAMPAAGLACEKDKTACTKEKAQPTVLKVVASGSGCCSAKGVANVVSSSGCTGAKGVANVVSATACEGGCPKQRTVALLMHSLQGGCGAECASKADVVAALRLMATYEKGLVCEKSLDEMLNVSNVSEVANVRTISSGECDPAACAAACEAACKAACEAGAKNQVVSAPLSDCTGSASTVVAVGQGSGCCASKTNVTTQTVNANVTTTGATCDASTAASTKYVAFGCEKTDRLARAAAKAYLTMMAEIKEMTGAEGCSVAAAKEVLASMIADMERDSKTEVAAVSFGAVSDKKSDSGCCAK